MASPNQTWIYPPSVQGLLDAPPDFKRETAAHTLTNFLPTANGIRLRDGLKLVCTIPEFFHTTDSFKLHSFVGSSDDATKSDQLILTTNSGMWSVLNTATGENYRDNVARRNIDADKSKPPQFITAGNFTDARSLQFINDGGNASLTVTAPQNTGGVTIITDTFNTQVRQATNGATNTTVDITGFGNILSYARRQIFIDSNTPTAWLTSLTGVTLQLNQTNEILNFNLAPFFTNASEILIATTVSRDTGDGADDFICLISDDGIMLIYKVTSFTTGDVQLLGRFEIPRPLGKDAFFKIDGDVYVGTHLGWMSVLSATKSSRAYISDPIKEQWLDATKKYPSDWTISGTNYDDQNFVLISPKGASFSFVFNTQTGAWSKFDWAITSTATHLGKLYVAIGNSIYQAYETGQDEYQSGTRPIVGRYIPRFNTLGSIYDKKATFLRVEYSSLNQLAYKAFVRTYNKADQIPPPPQPMAITPNTELKTFTRNHSVAAIGKRLAPGIVCSSQSDHSTETTFTSLELVFSKGARLS